MELLAKPNEKLKEHSEKVYRILCNLINYYPLPSQIKKSKEVSRNKRKLLKALKLTALLHDIGKADKSFQEYIRGRQNNSSPHALLGVSILKEVLSCKKFPNWICNLMILVMASHHSPYYGRLYNGYEGIKWSKDTDFSSLKDLLFLWKLPFDQELILKSKPYHIFNDARNHISSNANFLWRELLVYSQGLLIRADYYASSSTKPQKEVKFPQNIISKGKKIYWHQKASQKMNKDIFIQIPTGRGKTETALLWVKKFKKPNLFYILPTNASINAMYKRIAEKFGSENVGFYHSRYESLLLDEEKVNQGIVFKYFLKPVNITTPDQLLLVLMNFKKFPPREVIFSNSIFVFDEIHIYDAYTFFLIKWLIRILKEEYNAKICVMSATFPDFFKSQLNFLKAKEIGSRKQILEEYKSFKRTKPIIKNSFLKDNLDLVIGEFKKKKRVLVVVNTVRKSQEIYSLLRNEIPSNSIALLHSKFIVRDRQRKETRILQNVPDPFILVSTQVVEVSLDINFDVLFTELAYLDSLIQRFGRINRFGCREEFPVYILKPENPAPYEEDFLEKTLRILNKQKIKSEADYLLLTDKFYKSIESSLKEQSKALEENNPFEKIWKNLNYIAALRIKDVEGQGLLQTRKGILQIPMIPICFYDKIQEINKKIEQVVDDEQKIKLILSRKGYYVDVPIYLANRFHNSRNQEFIELEYNSEMGLILPSEDDNFI